MKPRLIVRCAALCKDMYITKAPRAHLTSPCYTTHTCTHMKTNPVTVQHAVVSGVESLTLAHKQASVQPSSPSPQTLACLNLAVWLISPFSTPPGLADAQLTAAFIRTYRVWFSFRGPWDQGYAERGILVKTAQKVETNHPSAVKADMAVGIVVSDACEVTRDMRAALSSASCFDGQSAPWTGTQLDLCHAPKTHTHPSNWNKPAENTRKVQRLP